MCGRDQKGENREVAGGKQDGGAMAGIGIPSPEFIARAISGTIDDGTSMGSKSR
jgi:hypothetical protein